MSQGHVNHQEPNYRAKCSCGARTILRWKAGAAVYKADDEGWKLRTNSEGGKYPLGWYCGGEGHHTAGSEQVTN